MTVKSLTIQSPMAINLQGIGEIIREVHEGVNDVYRNPLERRRREQQLEHNTQMNEMEVAETKHTESLGTNVEIVAMLIVGSFAGPAAALSR